MSVPLITPPSPEEAGADQVPSEGPSPPGGGEGPVAAGGPVVGGLNSQAIEWNNLGSLLGDVRYGFTIFPRHCRNYNVGICIRPPPSSSSSSRCTNTHQCNLCNSNHPLWRCPSLQPALVAFLLEGSWRDQHNIPPLPCT